MPTELEKIKELEAKIAYYETSGRINLFYALNRKQNEIAALLNKVNLKNLDLSDKDDKTFERIKSLFGDATNIATAVGELSKVVGITNNEDRDTQAPIYKITTPESIAQDFGDNKTQAI